MFINVLVYLGQAWYKLKLDEWRMKGENYQRLNPSFVLNSLCVLYLLSSDFNSETQQLLTKVYSFSIKLTLALESVVK